MLPPFGTLSLLELIAGWIIMGLSRSHAFWSCLSRLSHSISSGSVRSISASLAGPAITSHRFICTRRLPPTISALPCLFAPHSASVSLQGVGGKHGSSGCIGEGLAQAGAHDERPTPPSLVSASCSIYVRAHREPCYVMASSRQGHGASSAAGTGAGRHSSTSAPPLSFRM